MPCRCDEWVSWVALQVDGNMVTWEKWHIRTSFNYREGLVLHDVGCGTKSTLPRSFRAASEGFREPSAVPKPA